VPGLFCKRVMDCRWRELEWRIDCVRVEEILRQTKKQESGAELKLQEIEPKTGTNQIDHKRTNMKIPFSGGCACGAIRYQSTAEPVLMFLCHCRDCQRASGGPYSSYVIVPADAFKILQGSLRFHSSASERGGMTRRGFCPDCGSPVAVKTDSNPHIIGIRSASLDNPSWFKPEMNAWTSDAHPWDEMNPGLPKFEKYPV
jgi:hypothetical protein